MFEQNKKSNNPETLYREKLFEKKLMQAIKTLPEKIRLVLVLNAFEGLSYEEIARTLNIKKGTVSSRLHFARKNLINLLEMNE